eukprot:CAMPEP_0183346058 /NCGR_PEP_ID=MMETSP0164_2-20130417/11286_1 /TAXON_ID=221442 /ORGANISM="Coccolithus pelagicus ssp braarudi, Strain PLY182g" /LENGTH=55 /DNA_ID=CAMNT_0025517273 /DNA_START=51 /DNA_END=214 /DNA_ORIENTATION=+
MTSLLGCIEAALQPTRCTMRVQLLQQSEVATPQRPMCMPARPTARPARAATAARP